MAGGTSFWTKDEQAGAVTNLPPGQSQGGDPVSNFLRFACWDHIVHGRGDYAAIEAAAMRLVLKHPEIRLAWNVAGGRGSSVSTAGLSESMFEADTIAIVAIVSTSVPVRLRRSPSITGTFEEMRQLTPTDPGPRAEMRFRLRKAQPADLDFIWRLRVATMKEVISRSYGWDEDTQRRYAAESLDGEIVLVDERPVGVLTLADRGDVFHVVWMAVLPAAQRQGLGSALIAYCQQRARAAEKPLTLQVLRNNPAFSLYKRHGFAVYAENGPHKVLMRWDAAVTSPSAKG